MAQDAASCQLTRFFDEVLPGEAGEDNVLVAWVMRKPFSGVWAGNTVGISAEIDTHTEIC